MLLSGIGQITIENSSLPELNSRLGSSPYAELHKNVKTQTKTSFKTSAEISDQEKVEIRRLEAQDRNIRMHERTHQSAAQGLSVGPARYQFEKGPDGKLYATHGEVTLDTRLDVTDPQKASAKAQKIRQAAVAPINPSTKDLQVAATARKMEAKAQAKIFREHMSESIFGKNEMGDDMTPAIRSYRKNENILKNMMNILDLFS